MIPLAWVAEPAKSFFGARYLNNGLVLLKNVHSYKAEEKLFKVAPESTKLIGYKTICKNSSSCSKMFAFHKRWFMHSIHKLGSS